MTCLQYGIVKMLTNLIILQEKQKRDVKIVRLEDAILVALVLAMEFIKV